MDETSLPAYWHYDILQGLRLLKAVSLLDDSRAEDALDLVDDPGALTDDSAVLHGRQKSSRMRSSGVGGHTIKC